MTSNSMHRTGEVGGSVWKTSDETTSTTLNVDERPSRSAVRRVRTTPTRSQSQRTAVTTIETVHDRRLRVRQSSSQRSPAHCRNTVPEGAVVITEVSGALPQHGTWRSMETEISRLCSNERCTRNQQNCGDISVRNSVIYFLLSKTRISPLQ